MLLFCCGLSPRVAAQGYFTLTNGRLWWNNGLESDADETYRDPVAFDASRTDAKGNWLEVHPSGNNHVTQITAQGDTYLALDITNIDGGTSANPKIIALPHASFNLYCVWYRTDYTGYYYQEWYNESDSKTYRYYIVANSDEDELEIVRAEVGKPLEKSTYWYNWDFGAAAWEKPTIDGVEKNRYYWMMLQERNRANAEPIAKVWKLSHHCYQRPEDIYYDDYAAYASDPDGNSALKHYYDEVFDGTDEYFRVGNGALYMPVTVKEHEDSIIAIRTDGSTPYGLQRLSAEIAEMNFGTDETNVVTAVMKYDNSGEVPMDVRQAYTEYVEETYRRGINPNYRYRNEEGVFGSAGIGTFRQHNYWGGTDHGNAIPAISTVNATVDTIIFAVDRRSRRYIDIDTVYPLNDPDSAGMAVLSFFAPCNGTYTAEVYVTVRYDNGNVQRDTISITLKYTKQERDITKPTVGPIVRGDVFGGGRMANVGGGTEIYIHSVDTIKTLYGGNDIAGWVQGSMGANIILGTEFTSKEHPVHIGNVYGGGNGYYTYQGINSGFNEATGQHLNPYFWKKSTALGYQAYYFNGKVYPWNTLPAGYMASADEADRINKDQSEWDGLTPVTDHQFEYTPFYIGRPDLVDQAETGDDGDGTIPYIKTAHITVGVPEGSSTPFVCEHDNDSTHWHNDHIVIDTLFGGARNAFIGVTANEGESPENGVTIDINGGTMYAVFGGNNVGGTVANTSTVFIDVNNTKLLPSNGVVEETFLTGYGRDFGIRYLFGGGNHVDGSHSNVKIFGGMLDTVYLGGNNATVLNPIGTIECRKQGSLNGFGYDGHFICTNPTYPHHLDFTNPVAALDADEHLFDGYGPDNFTPEEGLYNLRCLFGGNNSADMDNMTTIQLHSGGISSVYGGGNVGDMNNNQTYTVNDAISGTGIAGLDGTHLGNGTNQPFPNPFYNYLFKRAYDIDPVTDTNIAGGWAEVYGRLTVPNKISTIVTALPNSKIVCDYIFGGSRIGNIKNAAGVYLAGGIYGYVTGGNDISGDIGSETGSGVYVVIDSNALVVGDAVGGSDGYYHCDDGTGHYGEGDLYDTYSTDEDAIVYDPYHEYVGMLLPTHNNVNFYLRGGLVLGQVVAGGVHADVGFDKLDSKIRKKLHDGTRGDTTINLATVGGERRGTVHFMASGGHVLGNGFGGGFQSKLHGLSYLAIRNNARIDGSFYCGNDCTGSIRSFGAYMNPNDYKRHYDSLFAVYSASMEEEAAKAKADVDALAEAYRDMVASDGTPLNTYDGYSWDAATSAYLRIKDTPYVHCVYGSGNGAYNYDGSRPEFGSISFCDDGSGSITPLQSSTFIDINTSGVNSTVGEGIDTVFGGGNGVGVEDKVVVLLNNTESDVHAVHTIFGGNNFDDMLAVVPEIRLLKGQVNTVYGGANDGVMGAKKSNDFKDVLGNAVADVSTHVKLESEDVTILDTLFGGSRMSDIQGNTFVEVVKTNAGGVDYIFGGNDISGTISGTTRIDVSGGMVHNIFGGSDGRYDFVEIGDNEYNVFPFGFYDENPTLFDGHAFEHADSVLYFDNYITTAGHPEIDSTNINIWGGTVGTPAGGVYGGGSMADCRATCVVVNDTVDGTHGEATIEGSVYGGGMGNYADLNNRNLRGERYGNVDEATHVHLHHAKELTGAKAYGGGRGGDVMNTYITTYKGWDTQLDSLFGGCWGSEVFGTTHVTINGVNPGTGKYNVAHLFGGNDFSGDVYKADVTVNSGHFNYIYGAGNGDYADSRYNSGVYKDDSTDVEHIVAHHIHRPNVEYVHLTFNDGEVDGNLYGGGKRGSTWTYQRNASREYVIGEHGHKVPDTALTTAQAHSDPKDYAYVITNIHGGKFHSNIFGGAAGSTDFDHPLIYGLKVVNMDAGKVDVSLYGGSQRVDDGYPAECKNSSTTTKRPSSIVNLTGGTIENNVYGAGYLGLTYGSAYLNIGADAIDSCVAYTQRYGSSGAKSAADSVYWQFKPGEEGSLSDTLDKGPLLLNHSVYVGSNWGNVGGTSDFTKPGFHGGESKIIIDGKNYNTDNNELNTDPEMNIAKSVFCAGTSVSGGDISNSKKIDIWNYGSIVNCQPTRRLESVQRSDNLMFHNSAIELTGAIDATSAYQSIPYSLKNITSASFRGYNVLEFDAVIDNVPQLHFYEEPLLADGSLEYVPIQELRQYTGDGSCADTATSCSNLSVVDPVTDGMQHTVFILNNGIDFEIAHTSSPKSPGGVSGFGYVFTPQGYTSTILATATAINGESWIRPGYSDWNHDLGGFASPCDTTNKYTADRGLVDWKTPTTDEQRLAAEHPYTNYKGGDYGDYRVWEVGNGVRLRETTILAHVIPDSLAQDVNFRTQGNSKMAVAEASIKLPATSTGHYYRLVSGITLSSENETLNLVDSAFMPSQNFTNLKTYYDGGGSIEDSVAPAHPTYEYGKILGTTIDNLGVATGLQDIIDHPTNTFGLVMVPGDLFDGVTKEYYTTEDTAAFEMPSLRPEDPDVSSLFVFTGNSHVTSFQHYITPKVKEGTALTPTMKFYLTYNTDFSTALLGTAEFQLMEYDAAGNEVAPIDVKVYISTIIEEFKPITTNVLAMYNAGRTNTFTRKVVLPATLEENRQLYLEKVYWVPTTINGEDAKDSTHFYLVKNEAAVTGAANLVNNLFALNVIPSEDLTSEMASNLGWSSINRPNINVYDLNPKLTRPSRYSDSTVSPFSVDSVDFTENHTKEGILIGTLDGRGTAVLNMQLTFDGQREYPATKGKGYVGKVIFNMASRLSGGIKRFPITVYVKTRNEADTIYIATADSVVRGSYKVKPYLANNEYVNAMATGTQIQKDAALAKVGKSPNWYVHSFQEALSTKVYQEGDVLCIIDTVKINNGIGLSIHGGNGPAIEVIRYEGHHHELPGEQASEVGVYRYGPMIQISKNGTNFTATNIAFSGSAGAFIKRDPAVDVQVPDTNRVFAPIFQVLDSGALVLHEGTSVRHNWNAYGALAGQLDANGLPKNSRDMGAISLTNNGSLTLRGNVDISQNLSHTYVGDREAHSSYDPLRPFNGAVYVDGGKVILPEAKEGTAITLTQNWLVDTNIHDPLNKVCWWDTVTIGGKDVRWAFRADKVADWQKANVFLTRKANVDDMHDLQSDMIILTGTVAEDSRIGVRKWFPGLETRDTIRFATCGGNNLTALSKAVENDNFSSDDGHRVFYNASVNNNYIYLFRCATFKHQLASQDMPLVRSGGTAYKGQDVLHYGIQEANTCPLGGDTILYRLQGGFAPYTYTWTMHDNSGAAGNYDILMDERTSPYSNSEITKALTNGDTSRYWASVIDTFLTPRVEMARTAGSRLAKVKVTAVDATGECSLTKYLNITIRKVNEYTDIPEVSGNRPLLQPTTSPTNGWTSVETDDTAVAIRYLKGVKITPYVYTDPSQGTIIARTSDSLYQYIDETHSHELTDLRFCEGDVIKLKTRAKQPEGNRFLMWSFNPYTTNPATYVVPNHDDDVIAYYGPTVYWKDHINTSAKAGAALASGTAYTGRPTVEGYTSTDGTGNKAGYVTTYNDDVHIYDENGLAWFISVVNGLNGTQARPFRFNTVYLHKKADGTDYDMKDYLWSPVGTLQYGFRGRFVCVDDEPTSTTPLGENDFVTVRNFILDEPDMENVAVFSFLDGAKVTGLNIRNIFVRGGHFVSALAASSQKSTIQDVGVDYVANPTDPAEKVTSILSTHYAVGTLIGKSRQDQVADAQVAHIKLVGDAVYVGGAVAQGVADSVRDSYIIGDNETNGNFSGGIQGDANGEPAHGLFRRKRSGSNTYIANNYVHMRNVGGAQNMGGIVGRAENTVLENNYVYGSMNGSDQEGGVAASMGNNSRADKNYYAQGDARQGVGMVSGNASVSDIASFRGKGNQVTLEEPVYGVNNLTRVLNKWVREHNAEGGNYKTWRSDLEGTNNGYPIFGEPDMIPVNAHETIDGCEVVVLGGVTYTRDTVITTRVIDNDEMIDSTLTATIRLHYGTQTALFDSALLADGYEGYGFSISPSELELLNLTLDSAGHVSLVFSDTLTTVYGCDSIVTLTLTFTGDPDQPIVETVTTVKVYPNPTTSVVNVETDEMSHVEVYDNEGRKLQDYDAAGRKKVVVDMTSFVTGIYFVRVHTPNEVIIQKVIKQR